MSTRVSIVDDDEQTRRILMEVIQSEPTLKLVSEYGSSSNAINKLQHDLVDVVLMDINMPAPNGVECVRVLKPQMLDTQFLMLTVYDSADHVFAALAAGATGYLLKSTRREEIVSAIEQIVAGCSPMSGAIARKVVRYFSEKPANRAQLESLSPREQSVLELLTQGYLYKEIAESLSMGVPTVATHIRGIYSKLHVRSRSEAIAKYFSR